MNALLFIHLIAVGIWSGSIAAEAVLEVNLGHPSPQVNARSASRIRFARCLAIPAILAALFTGIAMLRHVTWDAFLMIKVALAASAVVLHALAAFVAHRQRLNAQDMAGRECLNRWCGRIGIGCTVCLAGAAALGGLRMLV